MPAYLSINGVPKCQTHFEVAIMEHLMDKHERLNTQRTERFCPYGDETCNAGSTCTKCQAFFSEVNNFFQVSYRCEYADREEAEAARQTILKYAEQLNVKNIEIIDGECPAFTAVCDDEN